jgi:RimJ/RimL family protein N-acetyltransferase
VLAPRTRPPRASSSSTARPVGYIQFYRWLRWPQEADALEIGADEDTFGVDIFIGEPDQINRGVGTRAMSLICEHLERDCGATAVALTTESTNLRAQRAHEKAGFVKVREVLDTDTRDGQGIPSWLMVRSRTERDGVPASP